MKILAVADTEERCLWECFRKERFEGVDLILSAGDLDPDYLEFLVTVINKPLIYVRGNHDDRYARHAPGGCICVEDTVYVYRGVRIAGLGVSMRYRDVHQSYGPDFQRERQHACGTTIINACGYTQFELDQTRYPIRGWQAAWLNSQTMRRELKRHEAIESSTARTPGNHL